MIPAEKIQRRWRELWSLCRPRLGVIALLVVLHSAARICGLASAVSMKFVVNDVIGRHGARLMVPLLLAVVGAAIVQALAIYAVRMLVGRAMYRTITELCQSLQAQVCRLPVAFLDGSRGRFGRAHPERHGGGWGPFQDWYPRGSG